ncbi:DUF5681 domain-containing protein, partial [Nostoc sp. NIES-2111]
RPGRALLMANTSTRFQPGQSGNLAGKPKGTRNKTTLAIQALLDGEAEALGRKAVELALAGDTVALRLCIERILPPRKDRPLEDVDMPALKTGADAVAATARLFDHVASGTITPSEAGELAKLVETFTKSVELHELEQRLAALEART